MMEQLDPLGTSVTTACSYTPADKGYGIRAAIWAGAHLDAEPAPVLPEPVLVIPSRLYWAIGFALAAILAIVLVHVLRRQDHTDHDSPRSVRDAEQRERDRRDGPDLGP